MPLTAEPTKFRATDLATGHVLELEVPSGSSIPMEPFIPAAEVGRLFPDASGRSRTARTIKKWHESGKLKGGFIAGGQLYFKRTELTKPK